MDASSQIQMARSIHPTDDYIKLLDDWAGLNDPVERRRRQNRINQRAHRNRQRMQANKDAHAKSTDTSSQPTVLVDSNERSSRKKGDKSEGTKYLLLDRFTRAAYQSYMLGSPISDHLLVLTKVNVFRAMGYNLGLIGWSLDNMDDDQISPFNLDTPLEASLPEMPLALHPTKAQTTIAHHPWLDFFPLPKMRENLIRAGDNWDDEQLCQDLMGFWDPSPGETGLMVWGEPWDVRNWSNKFTL